MDSNNHTHFQDFHYKMQQYAGQVVMGERGEEYSVLMAATHRGRISSDAGCN